MFSFEALNLPSLKCHESLEAQRVLKVLKALKNLVLHGALKALKALVMHGALKYLKTLKVLKALKASLLYKALIELKDNSLIVTCFEPCEAFKKVSRLVYCRAQIIMQEISVMIL